MEKDEVSLPELSLSSATPRRGRKVIRYGSTASAGSVFGRKTTKEGSVKESHRVES